MYTDLSNADFRRLMFFRKCKSNNLKRFMIVLSTQVKRYYCYFVVKDTTDGCKVYLESFLRHRPPTVGSGIPIENVTNNGTTTIRLYLRYQINTG